MTIIRFKDDDEYSYDEEMEDEAVSKEGKKVKKEAQEEERKEEVITIKLTISKELWEKYKHTIPINVPLTDSVIYLIERRVQEIEHGKQ